MTHDEEALTLHERLMKAIEDGPEEERIKGRTRFFVRALVENTYHMRDHHLAFVADKVAMSLRMGTLSPEETLDIQHVLETLGLGKK
jgi:hypothetical protein